jgi:hypothetical protein
MMSSIGRIVFGASECCAPMHEKVNGSGYPKGLYGPEIPITARIYETRLFLLPIHDRHPGAQRAALVDVARNAIGERLGTLAACLQLDQRRGLSAFVKQLDRIHRGERGERVANFFFRYIIGQIADQDTHVVSPMLELQGMMMGLTNVPAGSQA